MRKLIAVGVGIFFLVAPTIAKANWQASKTRNGAYAAMSMTLPTKYERHALLIIDFNPRQNCAIHAGVNIFKGRSLGAFVENSLTGLTVYFETAGLRWSGGEIDYVKYTNGIEVMIAVGEDFIRSIYKRKDVTVQIGSEITLEFPSGSNFEAIEVARQTCWGMR